MKAIGNYRGVPQPATTTERRLAQVALFQGPRASVRFVDGTTRTMPSEPLRKLGLGPGGLFIMVVDYRGREITNVRVELQKEARGAAPLRAVPKVMVRDGLKLTTRR